MYQTTATRPAPRPAYAEPEYRLAGRLVSKSLYDIAMRANRDGRRVTLVLLTPCAGDTAVPNGVCSNCLGAERLGVDVLMAGPFKSAPSLNTSDTATGTALRPAVHNGAWWSVTRHFAPCPLCADVREIVL